MSLYEDLVAAWVPTKHDWLRHRPLGEALVSKLGKQRMFSYCAYDLLFLHFGTLSEVLDHLSAADSALVGRRHLCSIPATIVSDIAASVVVLSCKIADGVAIGEDSLIYNSNISGGIQIGSQSIVVGINIPENSDRMIDNSVKFMLPDCHCLWEVPLVGCIQENDMWKSTGGQEKCLWNAKLFPILSYFEMLSVGMWLMGLSDGKNQYFLPLWRNSQRVSLEELHRSIDFSKMCIGSCNQQADLAAGIAKACINYGMLGRNLSHLCEAILQKEIAGIEICKDFLDLALCLKLIEQNSKILPKSPAYQVQVDLLRACGEETKACELEHKVWAAVADETASAVGYGFGVRVDFVGGRSDTTPWSLERAAHVLNIAMSLEGSLPIGTIVESTNSSGVLISDDSGNELHIEELTSITLPFDVNDPFRLVKSALLVTGIIHENILVSNGLQIQTWANVAQGSGLGTSSIIADAVVKGHLQIIDGDDSNENVARLVLVLEQLMGTGGGWQDQIGGLYPGIKFTASYPGIPLRLQVFPLVASPQLISELQQRLLVVFTGQVSSTCTSSPRKGSPSVPSTRQPSHKLGEIMLEAWRLHQELDPYRSNEYVDELCAFADPYCSGYKLVGAGGGGFALLLAKDATTAKELRSMLEKNPEFDSVIYNWSVY
ncbi:hypothetical protein CRYUN_Cryun01aG0212900 [Craigia yunnanensis]